MLPARLLLVSVLVTAVPVVLGTALRAPDGPAGDAAPRAAAVGGAGTPAAAEDEALAVLHAWDRRRSRAWAEGDPARLRALYTPASRAGVRDQRMLRRWTDRGLVVGGLRTQVLDLEVLRREPRRLVLAVTDRVAAGEAVGRGVRERLPADAPTTRVVVLRRTGSAWRVAAVRPYRAADSPAASTAATSGSRKR